ncbi:hypothetical protein FVEG_02037 [Fusarium verticillioides 7600]|uniref:Uncharacterized protein n=1 Tax=Gibberella moniliformis (strain M3125 / FGSC 7600) TaxID=334819 RepID=W7LU84_GIBM7|nr:hypothetical protein FVEG_02037 [Fusarium verticillioides 7600]EWG39019.1 hypothetical protein FVEG_02037 [Fusarium verticillioides 7600]
MGRLLERYQGQGPGQQMNVFGSLVPLPGDLLNADAAAPKCGWLACCIKEAAPLEAGAGTRDGGTGRCNWQPVALCPPSNTIQYLGKGSVQLSAPLYQCLSMSSHQWPTTGISVAYLHMNGVCRIQIQLITEGLMHM